MTTNLAEKVLYLPAELLFSFEGALKRASSKEEYARVERGSAKPEYMAGADDAEVPPVPIPNTVVKLCCAEDTWLETTRENR